MGCCWIQLTCSDHVDQCQQNWITCEFFCWKNNIRTTWVSQRAADAVATARDAAMASGIDAINGLVIDEENGVIEDFYLANVIDGTNVEGPAFVIAIDSFDEFAPAVLGEPSDHSEIEQPDARTRQEEHVARMRICVIEAVHQDHVEQDPQNPKTPLK